MDRSHRSPPGGRAEARRVVWEKKSVPLGGIGPAGQSGHRVELAEQLAYQLFAVVFCTDLIELPEDARQRAIGVGDGAFRKVLTLLREALPVTKELLSVEIGGTTGKTAGDSAQSCDACHATPRVGHTVG